MFAVIFRGTIKNTDDKSRVAIERMKHLALVRYGCTGFYDVVDQQQVLAVSYWPDMASMRAWKEDPAHPLVLQPETEPWYLSYNIQIVAIKREYSFDLPGMKPCFETIDKIGI